jgi:hypothetical protein
VRFSAPFVSAGTKIRTNKFQIRSALAGDVYEAVVLIAAGLCVASGSAFT